MLGLQSLWTCCCLEHVHPSVAHQLWLTHTATCKPRYTSTQAWFSTQFQSSIEQQQLVLTAAGAGVGGSNATCVNVATQKSYGQSGTGGGGLGFSAVNGTNAGYQPFAGKTTLDFWVKSNSTGPGDESEVGYPKGSLPDLNLYLSNAEAQEFCAKSLQLTDLKPVGTEQTENGGTYYHFQIPFDSFNCAGGSAGSLANIDSLGFGSNSGADYASFCIDNLVLA